MDKYDFFSRDNILILAEGDVKKTKKGTGLGELLALAREMLMFMEKIDSCAEAQDITENKQKVEAMAAGLQKNYMELLNMAGRGRSGQTDPSTGQEAAPAPGPSAPALPTSPAPMG